MWNQKRKVIQGIRDRLATFLGLTAICVIFLLGTQVTPQGQERELIPTDVKRNVDNLAVPDDEVTKLIEILRKREAPPDIIITAIQTLGRLKAKEAIPELIRYLDFKKEYPTKQPEFIDGIKIDGTELGRTIPLSGIYPAAGALFQIGEPAIPALIAVIGAEESISVKSENALYALQQIFPDDLPKAVAYLEDAILKSRNPSRRRRLGVAVQKSKQELDDYLKMNRPERR